MLCEFWWNNLLLFSQNPPSAARFIYTFTQNEQVNCLTGSGFASRLHITSKLSKHFTIGYIIAIWMAHHVVISFCGDATGIV